MSVETALQPAGESPRVSRGGSIGNDFVADFEPMLQTPPLVIDAEDDHEGRRTLRDANLVRAQVTLG